LNEVLLNGDDRDGGFFRKRVLVGHTDKNTKPEEVALTRKPEEGETPSACQVVFLKVRRKLVERGKKGEIVRSTNEHNHKGDVVTLYESATRNKVTGIASDLRERYEGLRTVQIVYALLLTGEKQPELVRIVIKGASLGSEAKAESVTSFYQYLGSFQGEDHFYNFKTLLQPVTEHGTKSYYAIDFQRGERLSSESQQVAFDTMRQVHENCLAVDEARAERIAKADVPEEEPEEEQPEQADYPTGDINPDDIPF
jgi:hypothetical protein